MSSRPVNVAILWHMHQPFYKDLVTGEFILPWVRLHAAKDYFDMVDILKDFPNVKANFNLVPSLLLQIEDYVAGRGADMSLELTLKDPKDLTTDDKIYILHNFFMANWDTMVKPYPRYLELLYKRGRYVPPSEFKASAMRFSPKEMMDLQVWFNLTWFGQIYKTKDPVVAELIKKGKNFTEEDKRAVVDKQKEILAKIIPAYREAQDRGQIELTTSPFYHPILPLLCDTNSAREAMPWAKLPDVPFRHPEDAESQIKLAVEYHASRFGRPPKGMWPSEGSVSEQVIPLIARHGIKWIATDEAILERTLQKLENNGRRLTAEELYQSYLMEQEGASVAIVFRNHFISDQIGFVYSKWSPRDSVNDLMGHLNNIRISLPDDGREYLVSVILDGENAWEYYPDQAKHFFDELYSRLSTDQMVRTVKIGEFIEQNPPTKKLTRLFAGSWIDSNFKIWIGHEEDNTAWNALQDARRALSGTTIETNPLVWQQLYIAEGSDWWWWYGDDHSSENDAEFDMLFRKYLKNIYSMVNKPSPRMLDLPIKKTRFIKPVQEPAYLINPILDGKVTDYFEWLAAGHFDISKVGGAMHQTETALHDVFYGFNFDNLFVRLDLNFLPFDEEYRDFSYSVLTFAPRHHKANLGFSPQQNGFAFTFDGSDGKEKELKTFAVGRIIEMAIPFPDLGVEAGQKVEFAVVIYKGGQELERWPKDGSITVTAPTVDFELENWSV